jgi:TorA maturation chaperone TorD
MDSARAVHGANDPEPAMTGTIQDEEQARAALYALLARLLAAPADSATLAAVARIWEGEDGELGQALGALARAAAKADPALVAREYHDLFIGVGRGELLPYASYYLTGFLHEKPLADLRGALARLGIARADEVAEPEDHIAALCEVMRGLIAGAFGAPAALADQQKFFDSFIAPWAARFFTDLEGVKPDSLYAIVGRVGRLFLGVEQTAFTLA